MNLMSTGKGYYAFVPSIKIRIPKFLFFWILNVEIWFERRTRKTKEKPR